jgi:23S rRNA G2445 N2-methylase RlmL
VQGPETAIGEIQSWSGVVAVLLVTGLTILARVTGIIPTQRDLDAVAKTAKKAVDDVAADMSRVEGRVDGVSGGLSDLRTEWREDRARFAGRLDALQVTIVTLTGEVHELRKWRHEHGQDSVSATVAAAALTRQAERLAELVERMERRER